MKKLTTLLLIVFSINASAQTILKDIPIISNDPYLIKAWAHNPETNQWGWYEIQETGESTAWYVEKRIPRCTVDPGYTLDVLFIRGFEDCADTTRLTIYGSHYKEIIKDKPDLRKTIKIDGSHQYFGTKIERPN